MADTLQQNDLSNGAFNTPQMLLPGPSIIPQGGRPADVIGRAQQLNSSVGFLQYPMDLPKYYMGFEIQSYKRDSLLAIGQGTPINQIALPFPDLMLDVNAVAFDQAQFSATIGNMTNAGFQVANKVGDSVRAGNTAGIASNMNDALKDTKLDGVTTGVGIDIGKALTGEQGQAVLGAAGYSPNYFLTVVLNGPRYKQHSFSWTMAPRNPQEAAQLTQVIRVFKGSQAPGLALGGALFSFPHVFKNYFAPDRGHLYQFKPSVLINFTVNYAPAGFPSMKQPRAETNNWSSPSALKVTATFLELEFWLRSDFGDIGPNASPNQEDSNLKNPKPGPGRNA
jgi:hypothetical protein